MSDEEKVQEAAVRKGKGNDRFKAGKWAAALAKYKVSRMRRCLVKSEQQKEGMPAFQGRQAGRHACHVSGRADVGQGANGPPAGFALEFGRGAVTPADPAVQIHLVSAAAAAAACCYCRCCRCSDTSSEALEPYTLQLAADRAELRGGEGSRAETLEP